MASSLAPAQIQYMMEFCIIEIHIVELRRSGPIVMKPELDPREIRTLQK